MELHFQRWPKEAQNPAPNPPKIVLLHGMGGTGQLWRPVAASLEDRFEILAPDQRGHGRSRIAESASGPAAYRPEDYARDVSETLASTGFQSAWIVGHSMGARTAAALAHLHPEQVQGLILVDLGFDGLAGGGLGEGLGRFIRVLPEHFPSRQDARSFMEAHCPDPSIAQYLMAVSTPAPAELGGGIQFPFDHSALVQTIEKARGTSIRPWIEEAADRGIPVLALRGETSRVWSRDDFEAECRHFKARKSKGRVELREIAGAGHGLPFEKRAEFVAALEEFIGG